MIKQGFIIMTALLWAITASAAKQLDTTGAITVPLGGNGWVHQSHARIDKQGLSDWKGKGDTIYSYVRFEAAGSLNIALRLKTPSGESKIGILCEGKTFTRSINAQEYKVVPFGKVSIEEPGYVKLAFYGINKTGDVFADVSDLILSGDALSKDAAYVKDDRGDDFYWGHRGPSVHLNYAAPVKIKENVEWFYNEITVPPGEDKQGSYFMADGFTDGYFGMQVNSATERHVLFSIWSPFTTDNPKDIPDSLRIKLLKNGAGVHIGEFGSEGSGGQSYLNYPWNAGKTYSFLLHAVADTVKKTTTYTAYFKPKDEKNWQLIASFERPQSGYYLKSLYSFLENFDEKMGDQHRKAFYGNQWVVSQGQWYPINEAVFTGDAIAKIGFRKDFGGGVKGNLFYLRNGGFFNDFTPLKSKLHRELTKEGHPEIDLDALQKY